MPLFKMFIPIAILLLVEWYGIVLVRYLFKGFKVKGRNLAVAAYILLTLSSWAFLFFYRRIEMEGILSFRSMAFAFVFGFTIAKMMVATLLLLDDIRRIIQRIFAAKKPIIPKVTEGEVDTPEEIEGIKRSTFIMKLATFLGLGSIAILVRGATNRYNYQVRHLTIPIDHLPQALHGFRIVQLSDIHVGSFDNHDRVAAGVQMVLNQKPDLILFTGDLVNNRSDELLPYKDLFATLKAPYGVYSTLGNHDYGDYENWPSPEAKIKNLQDLKLYEAEMGWQMLNNQHVVLEKGGAKFAIIGVENWSAIPRFPRHGNLKKAYEGLEQHSDIAFKVLMSHDPTHWDAQVVPSFKDINLTLSGHTHGMQFGIEIPGFKWSPAQFMYKQWADHYQQGDQHIYVNRGFGYLGYPGRVGILPEITVIDFVTKS